MKIAHITTIDMALHLLLLNQLKSLQEVGFEVVGISSAGPDVAAVEAAGIRHIAVPMTRNFTPAADLMALKNLYDVMRRERFTIVHTHTPKPGLLGQMAARMAGVPIIVNTLHGFYFHDHMPTFWRQFYIATEKIAARCSHAILSQNSEDVQTAIREKICRPEQIEFLGNGINAQRFDQAKINEELLVKMRSDLGLTDADQVVGFVGRLVQEKGILDLLQAARIVLEHKPKTKFLIIGPIDEEKPDALRPTVAQDYGIAENCVFTGRRKDMPELYALMDVFVLPSYREGFPRSPMEAAAMGVPCIATDIRGCREAVIHNDNGLLYPLGNVKALAEAILTLLRDHRLAQQLGQAGRKLALAKFDEQLVFDKVKAKYARLLKEQGMPVPDLLSAQIVAS